MARERPPGIVKRLIARIARNWLAFRYRLLSRRYGQLVLEEIDGVPLIVLPQVFNPVLLRTGVFLARSLAQRGLPSGSRVLDMGTGSGVGAVFAARLGGQVTAVDINPEAVRCARLNALLNEVEDRIEVRHGNLFEPLPGQRFDLVLFNPPFYRGRPHDNLDLAWRGEDVFEQFAAGLSHHLTPDGRCWLLLSSDGDGQQLLTILAEHAYDVQMLSSHDLRSELLKIYEIRTSV